MLKKITEPTCNVSMGVELILRGARKRRSMALATAKQMNLELGIQTKLVAIK